MAPRKDYSVEQMAKAIDAVKKGQMVATAARQYGVPRVTLHNKITGKSPIECTMGPSTVLSKLEEDILERWLVAISERHFPLTKDLLLDSVRRIITDKKISNPFTNNRPGKKWFNSFLKRHPDIVQRTSQNLTTARDNVTEKDIKNWFLEIEKYLEENGLKEVLQNPTRIFNTDESAFFLAPKPGRVLAKRGEKHVYSSCGDEKDNLTVLITGNAAGKIAPPMVVFSYERIPSNIASSVPEDWAIGKSDTGWMCSSTFYEYVTNIFNPWLEKENIEKPILFFLDGHRSHLTLHLSNFCFKNGIEIIALYPNSTHILQPMDIAVFRPLKVAWRKAVTQWKMEHLGQNVKKEHFSPVLKKALSTISEDCIKNGFRGGGLYPFGPEYIDMNKIKNRDPVVAEKDELKRKHFISYLESEIVKNFTLEKLNLFNKLFYRSRNTLENLLPDEDMSLYTIWAKNRQTLDKVVNTSFTDGSLSDNTVSLTCNIEQNSNVLSPPIEPENPELAGTPDGPKDTTPPVSDIETTLSSNIRSIEPDNYTPTRSTDGLHNIPPPSSINETNNTSSSPSSVDRFNTNPLPTNDATSQYEPTPSTSRIDSAIQYHTPTKITLDNALGIDVPSPFKRSLFWPEIEDKTKKRRNKEKIPSAITSKAWREYHEKKEAEKIRKQEEKDNRAKQRQEKKILKEKIVKEKKKNISLKAKKKRMCEYSSSEDTDLENQYVQNDESDWEEHTDQITGEVEKRKQEKIFMRGQRIQEDISRKTLQRKRQRSLSADGNFKSDLENVSLGNLASSTNKIIIKNMTKGCYVIVKYEGEYYAGKIENTDGDLYEISTMVLSTANTFRWPERPDKIWYKAEDIVEKISDPAKYIKRGFYKIVEMDKYLPVM